MKKREIFLLLILFIGIYAFIFVKFIWGGAIPEIETVKAEIVDVKREKAQLDEDKKNIENLKNSLDIKTVQDERIDEYLMSDASSADSIDYLDKLTKLFEKSVTDISFENPLKIEVLSEDKGSSTTGDNASTEKKKITNTYYEFRFSFKADMTYEEAMDLVNFIEGGSRKVKISKFDLLPSKNNAIKTSQSGGGENNNDSDADETLDGLFAVDMSINMYSKNLGSINNIYNYANNNYNRFINNEGKVIVPNSNVNSNEKISDGIVSHNDTGSGGSSVAVATEKKARDITMRLGSFMTAGPNLLVYGSGGYSSSLIRYKTQVVSTVQVDFYDETYSVEVSCPDNGTDRFRGSFSREEPHIVVISNFPRAVPENKDLGIDIKISNQSGKMVSISLTDYNNSVRITDRNGSVIRGYSKSENVKIL